MKSKTGHYSWSADSDEPDASANSSSSGIDSGASSLSEHHYDTKKRKRADSSGALSDSDEQMRSKERKHKKGKHSERKKRSDYVAESISGLEDVSSASEDEISSKKKHNLERSSSVSVKDEEQIQRHLRSVVIKCYGSSDESNNPTRIIYNMTECQRSVSPETPQAAFCTHEREQVLQRFYRGSSKERRQQQYQKQYTQCHRENNSRNTRYVEHRYPKEEYQRRSGDQEERYHHREVTRGFNRYIQYGKRGGHKRRNFEDRRNYNERHGLLDNDCFRVRGFPDRKKRQHEEGFSSEGQGEVHREKPVSTAGRPVELAAPHYRERSRSRSQEEQNRRPKRPAGKEERYRKWRDEVQEH